MDGSLVECFAQAATTVSIGRKEMMTPDTRIVAEMLTREDLYLPVEEMAEDAFGEVTEIAIGRVKKAIVNIRNRGIHILSRPGQRIEEIKESTGMGRKGFEYCVSGEDWLLLQVILHERDIDHNPTSPEELEERKRLVRAERQGE